MLCRKICLYLKESPIYHKILELKSESSSILINSLDKFVTAGVSSTSAVIPDDSNQIESIDPSGSHNLFNNSCTSLSDCSSDKSDLSTFIHSNSIFIEGEKYDVPSPSELLFQNSPAQSISPDHIDINCKDEKYSPLPVISPVPLTTLKTIEDRHINSIESSLLNSDIVSNTYSTADHSTSMYNPNIREDMSQSSPVSSPLQISPALPSQGQQDNSSDELDDFGSSLPATNLIDGSDDDMLDQFEDETSYSDFSDINLSSCPLASLDNIKDEMISLPDSMLDDLHGANSPINGCSGTPEFNSIYPTFDGDNILTNHSQISPTSLNDQTCRTSVHQAFTGSYGTQISNCFSNTSVTFTCNDLSGNQYRNTNSISKIPANISPKLESNLTISQSMEPISSNTIFQAYVSNDNQLHPQVVLRPNLNLRIPSSLVSGRSPNYVSMASQVPTTCITTQSLIQSPSVYTNVIPHKLGPIRIPNRNIVTVRSLPSKYPQPINVLPGNVINKSNYSVAPNSNNGFKIEPGYTPSSDPNQKIVRHSVKHVFTAPSISIYSTSSGSKSALQLNPNLKSSDLMYQKEVSQSPILARDVQVKTEPNTSLYSVMYNDNASTKITIKRSPDSKNFLKPHTVHNIAPQPLQHDAFQQNQFNSNLNELSDPNNLLRKPKSRPKPKPKRKGCRCGNATPSPGKLTCCGQRCPCYVEAKACIDCRCKGCRNPHRPGGKKVRPVIPHQANIRIHQLQQPFQQQPLAGHTVLRHPAPVSLQHNVSGQQLLMPCHQHVSNQPRPFHTLHGVKAVTSLAGGALRGAPLANSAAPNEGSLPTASVISMKPIKVRLDSTSNQFIKAERFLPSQDMNIGM